MSTHKSKTHYAVYDLEICPASFDIMKFARLASAWADASQATAFSWVIIAAEGDGFRRDHLFEAMPQKQLRLRNVLLPTLLNVVPSADFHFFQDREDAKYFLKQVPIEAIFPKDYSVDEPVAYYQSIHVYEQVKAGLPLGVHRAHAPEKGWVDTWLKSKFGAKRIVTISLRECDYNVDRNSNVAAWLAIAAELTQRNYGVVIVRDTQYVLQPFELPEGCATLALASYSVECRIALFEAARINMVINNGPSGFLWGMPETAYLFIKVVSEKSNSTTVQHHLDQGLLPGDHWPEANSYQKYIWAKDDLLTIRLAFDELEKALDNQSGRGDDFYISQANDAKEKRDYAVALSYTAVGIANYPQSERLAKTHFDILVLGENAIYALYFAVRVNRLGLAHLQLDQATLSQNIALLLPHLKKMALNESIGWSRAAAAIGVKPGLKQTENKRRQNTAVFIFGAGAGGRNALNWLRKQGKIVEGFIDNAKDKQGTLLDGVPVCPFDALFASPYHQVYIASVYRDSILMNLLLSGVSPIRIEGIDRNVLEGRAQ